MNFPSISVTVEDMPDESRRFTAMAVHNGQIYTSVETVSQFQLEMLRDVTEFTQTLKKSVAHRLLEHLTGIV